MARFLVTYHGTEMPHEPEAMARSRDAFIQWAGKTGAPLVEPGAPVGTSKTLSRDGSGDGPADGPFNGWSVVEADDVDAALELLRDHPFIERGGILQVSVPVEF
jgi:hypothetical protein